MYAPNTSNLRDRLLVAQLCSNSEYPENLGLGFSTPSTRSVEKASSARRGLCKMKNNTKLKAHELPKLQFLREIVVASVKMSSQGERSGMTLVKRRESLHINCRIQRGDFVNIRLFGRRYVRCWDDGSRETPRVMITRIEHLAALQSSAEFKNTWSNTACQHCHEIHWAKTSCCNRDSLFVQRKIIASQICRHVFSVGNRSSGSNKSSELIAIPRSRREHCERSKEGGWMRVSVTKRGQSVYYHEATDRDSNTRWDFFLTSSFFSVLIDVLIPIFRTARSRSIPRVKLPQNFSYRIVHPFSFRYHRDLAVKSPVTGEPAVKRQLLHPKLQQQIFQILPTAFRATLSSPIPVTDGLTTGQTDASVRFFLANFADAIMISWHVSFGLRIRDAVDFFINNTSDCAGT
ncbi:hypothetical protein C8Q75DRAFT_735420 [Abortiporus biennis]|nr:hypothetical protein C8Q75DRAFT_735420 [Abortiporus biennis]